MINRDILETKLYLARVQTAKRRIEGELQRLAKLFPCFALELVERNPGVWTVRASGVIVWHFGAYYTPQMTGFSEDVIGNLESCLRAWSGIEERQRIQLGATCHK